jgi:hypothetical protein
MRRVAGALDSVGPLALFLAFFAALFATHANSLFDPPYWDALSGAFTQAHWQATHSFSPFYLLADTPNFNDGGACVYPFSVYPMIVGAFERFGVGVAATFCVMHLVSLAAGAGMLAATYRLARRACGGGLALLATIAVATLPLFRAVVSQMNMDVLLGACTVLAFLAIEERRCRAAVSWSACALLVKPTGIIVVVALFGMLLLRRLRPGWFETSALERQTLTRSLAALAGLFVLFCAELATIAHFGKSPPGVSFLGGAVPFLAKRLWTLPEFGLALLALALALPFVVRRVRRRQAATIEIDGLVFAVAFVGFYCQYENVLPRYFAQAFPIVLVALVATASGVLSRGVVAGALVLFAAFGLLNAHGRFHPMKLADWSVPGDPRPLVTNDGWLLERSLEYRDDLDLNRSIAAACEALRDNTIVAGWPILQLLGLPRLGYVTSAPRLASAETPLQWTDQKIEIAGRVKRRLDFVRVVSPNVYASESSRVLPGDVVLETFARGRLRAFLVRRPSDSDAERR